MGRIVEIVAMMLFATTANAAEPVPSTREGSQDESAFAPPERKNEKLQGGLRTGLSIPAINADAFFTPQWDLFGELGV